MRSRNPFIVAEMSCNHLGSKARALEIIDAAASAGADAVKFQCWTKDSMCVSDYVIGSGSWEGRRMRDLYAECYTPWEWFADLFERTKHHGMVPFASAFDIDAVDFLESLRCPIHKVASMEAIDIPLVTAMARTRKPLMISTGAVSYTELAATVKAARRAGAEDITLLHCVAEYPAPIEHMNLATMADMRKRFGVEVGISDHSFGQHAAMLAVAAGAAVIEKHLTINREDGGPDAGFSMEPWEFSAMVHECRRAHGVMGTPLYADRHAMRRTMWLVKDIRRGEEVTYAHLRSARPALGDDITTSLAAIGMTARQDQAAGTPFTWALVR